MITNIITGVHLRKGIDRGEILVAIEKVLEHLFINKNQQILANQHPLHNSVVSLEKLILVSYTNEGGMERHLLPSPLRQCFWNMLWATREQQPTFDPMCFRLDEYKKFRNLPVLNTRHDTSNAAIWGLFFKIGLKVFEVGISSGYYHSCVFDNDINDLTKQIIIQMKRYIQRNTPGNG